MRAALIESLLELAAEDDRIFLLTADLGWSVLDRFAKAHPDRFLNVGVAEQNMASVATGLARVGYMPFIYSIATFSSMRCYEQIRDGAALHQLPVRVVGIGGGYAYGHAGPTHYALEDLAIARTQPGITVIAPADRDQARTAIRRSMHIPGPVYFRLDKNHQPPLDALHGKFDLDRPEVVRKGSQVLFLTTGSITAEALKAADLLERHGISAGVAVQAHLPFSAPPALEHLLRRYRTVISVEEGFAAGGLGSLAAETIAQADLSCELSICGVTSLYSGFTGGTDFMRRQSGLDAESLFRKAQLLCRARIAA